MAATIGNVHRDPKKKRLPFEAIDFVPGARKRVPKTDAKLIKAQLQAAFAGIKKS